MPGIRYGRKRFPWASSLFYRVSCAVKSPTRTLRSLRADPALAGEEVACVMCVWDEQANVGLALESSKGFMDRYVVVDKNGGTLPVVRECADTWGLDVECHVKPELSLAESRMFAFERSGAEWVLV